MERLERIAKYLISENPHPEVLKDMIEVLSSEKGKRDFIELLTKRLWVKTVMSDAVDFMMQRKMTRPEMASGVCQVDILAKERYGNEAN